jgi:hypothetical protein
VVCRFFSILIAEFTLDLLAVADVVVAREVLEHGINHVVVPWSVAVRIFEADFRYVLLYWFAVVRIDDDGHVLWHHRGDFGGDVDGSVGVVVFIVPRTVNRNLRVRVLGIDLLETLVFGKAYVSSQTFTLFVLHVQNALKISRLMHRD